MSSDTHEKRGRGRPRRSGDGEDGLVDREKIIDLAYDLARSQSIDQVSFVQLAKAFEVKPGALHYHIGTKDDLTSAILNRFYRELLAKLTAMPEEPDWRRRLSHFAQTLMTTERDHRGAAEHIQTHAKFRVFQRVRDGETDYGAAYLDHAFSLLRGAGFDAETAALCYHVLALHCLSAATSASSRLEPSAHENFLTARAEAYESGEMPGLEFALRPFARVRADDAFQIGLEALLDRFATMRRGDG
ncbi:TetR/AcrR family transcriptional regulator [uncultured Paracoccus sp.]|uniref:TetR/AcrR family transcriptional regulator n=1 Tax=uncultured Paracoccus sp. TaxID=189685 RepID=UPI002637AE04|nr:TetR/AcrR family transcriptional regulator [uncultured Paracoccus sp.]